MSARRWGLGTVVFAALATACQPRPEPVGVAALPSGRQGGGDTEASAGGPPPSSGALAAEAASAKVEPAASSPVAIPRIHASPSPPPPGCPAEMAAVEGYCIDRWEAGLVALGADGVEQRHPHFKRPAADVKYLARAAPGVFPQGYISRVEASSACGAAGKRLCTLREWHRACAGPRGLRYPYGRERVRGACNSSKAHLLGRLFGDDPRLWTYDEQFNSPALLQEPGFLATAGAHERCVSEEGVFDLVGNLHEWVADRVDHELPSKIDLLEDIRAKIGKNLGHGIFMGGFFSTTSEHGSGCLFLTPGHEPKYHDYSTGFRCCRERD